MTIDSGQTHTAIKPGKIVQLCWINSYNCAKNRPFPRTTLPYAFALERIERVPFSCYYSNMRKFSFPLILMAILVLSGCLSSADQADPNRSLQNTIRQFHRDLEKPGLSSLEQAIIREQIAIYKGQISTCEMIRYVTDHVRQNPDDQFNSYYLYRIALTYQEQGFDELAYQFYHRIYTQFPDVSWQNHSIHFLSLQQLVQLANNGSNRVHYLQELLNQYPDKIERGLVYFQLANALESIGEYNEAMRAYESFLRLPNTLVPGHPGIHHTIREKVAFHHSSKNWLRPDLDILVNQMKNILATKNGRALVNLQAKANFFSVSWHQDRYDVNARPDFNLLSFLYGDNRIRFADSVELMANGNEALLRTWGWSPRIPTWFLYFRKVHYPANPEIHGSWEWAGIYFGETR